MTDFLKGRFLFSDATEYKNRELEMKWLETIHAKRPLIECLTNEVTCNEVANTILACGASPVMGCEKSEIHELVSCASAVVINIGTLRRSDLAACEEAWRSAAELRRPVVFDPVGAGATRFRTEVSCDFLTRYRCAVIRGNVSEIRALAGESGHTSGVDASTSDAVDDTNLGMMVQLAARVAARYGCIVSMSGAIDIMTDGQNTSVCRNGVECMSRVTGTGCALTGLTAAFVAVARNEDRLQAAVQATAMMGIAGEQAARAAAPRKNGAPVPLGTFRVKLADALSCMTDADLDSFARLERID